jgi:hypothetical protein
VSALPHDFVVTTCFVRSDAMALLTVRLLNLVFAASAAWDGKMRSP